MCGADLSDLGDENPSEKKEKMNGSAISSSKDGDKKGTKKVPTLYRVGNRS